MRRLLVITAALVLVLGLALEASANRLTWNGTLTTKLGAGRPSSITVDGLASINGGLQGKFNEPLPQHVNTLRIAITSGVPGGNAVPITDPEVTGVIRTIATTVNPGSGTFAPISGGGPLTQNTYPVPGTAKICLVLSGCPSFLPLFLTENNGNTGVGVGGLVTVGKGGSLRVSLENNPWTIGTGMAVRETDNGARTTVTVSGFVHGPASNTSTTGDISGVIQLITPIQVTTIGVPGESEKLSLFGTMRIHFVPEPGLMLLLGSGVVGLALLGRSRMKKK